MSNDILIEERVAKIESRQNYYEDVLSENRIDTKEIKESLMEIKTSLAISHSQSIEPRVRALEDNANQMFGGWKMAALWIGFAGLILKNLLDFYLKNK